TVAPGSCLSSWDFSVDPCDHLFSDRFTCGFRCDRIVSGSARVTEITLDPSFSGSVPDSLSKLVRRKRLALSGNSFKCLIHASVGSLSQLEELYLDNNDFQGPRLEIRQNSISSEFPYLGSLKSLSFLDASDNNITGKIPPTFPTSLVELSVRNNNLVGNVPENFGDMEFLQVLDLILFDHPSLQQVTLSYNNFTSLQVPANMGLTSKLVALELSYNELGGFLPAYLASMPNLSALSLEHNKFIGMIPTQFALKRLLWGGNYLFGPISGHLMGMKPGFANVSLVDNCLYMCPEMFFFCQGGDQNFFFFFYEVS
ncbi:hypothetical protein CICLE_v10003978mg, partial [Citrus x clementina]